VAEAEGGIAGDGKPRRGNAKKNPYIHLYEIMTGKEV
jgi:hypothetical protein